MWAGACTSSIGTWMQKLAQSWLVLQLSGSPFLLGLDAFLGEIPIFLFSLVGGVVADRVDRRHVLLISQFVQMSCAFLLAGLIAYKVVEVWHILALSCVVGFAQAFGGPAYQALIPTLVKPEHLPNAIAMNSIQFNVARVIGPVLGGLTLTQLGAAWCFGLNGLSFVAVMVSLVSLRIRFVPGGKASSMLASMRQGFGFIQGKPGMVGLIVLAFLATMLGIPLMVFLPVFAKDVFQEGPTVYTLLLAFSGAGSILGALSVAAFGNTPRKGRVVVLTLVVLGALMVGFSLSRRLALSCAFVFFAGAAMIIVFATLSSLVQLLAHDDMRGRVMSVYNVAFRGGMPMGSLLAGALAPALTAPVVLAGYGVLLSALGLYFLVVQRKVAAL
jgi:predicted MFS family arabinose efflux permease